MRRRALVMVAVVALASCKKDEAAGGGAPEKPAVDTAALKKTFEEKALPGIVAALPADGPKVELEARLLKDDVLAAVPKGWTEGMMPGSFEPPKDASLGFMTRYGVSTNCDGSCAPKDWKAVAEKVEFAQFKGEQFQVATDEALTDPEGRVVVATVDGGKKTYIAAARWKTGASKYLTCRATLEAEAKALAPAFEKACRAAVGVFLAP